MSLDYLDLEFTTTTHCDTCGDLLAEWETQICLICETLAE